MNSTYTPPFRSIFQATHHSQPLLKTTFSNFTIHHQNSPSPPPLNNTMARINPKRDYYAILHVRPTAFDDEIANSYHVLNELHTGVPCSIGTPALLEEAWGVIGDRSKRRIYNSKRRRGDRKADFRAGINEARHLHHSRERMSRNRQKSITKAFRATLRLQSQRRPRGVTL